MRCLRVSLTVAAGNALAVLLLLGCQLPGNTTKTKATPSPIPSISPDDDPRIFYEKACEKNDAYGCVQLAVTYIRGTGVPVDDKKAFTILTKVCEEMKYDPGCSNLGYLYDTGRGTYKDTAKATELYRRSCDGDDEDGYGCSALGTNYLYGQNGVAKDEAKAAQLFELSCARSSPSGCGVLGYLYATGSAGVPQSGVLAVKYYRKACDGNDDYGCNNLGIALRDGRADANLLPDREGAKSAFRKSCDKGYASACSALGVMLQEDATRKDRRSPR